MRNFALAGIALLGVAIAPCCAAQRVVSLGGDVTEIIYALGQEKQIVCDDQTSLYPIAATKLPQVGYLRTLAAEGVLSCKPDLIIASEDAGPPAAMAQLAQAHAHIVSVANAHTPQAVLGKISTVANALGVAGRGRALQATFKSDMANVTAQLAHASDRPKAIFVMAQGPGGLMVAGRGTGADAMFTLAKAVNAAEGFEGYKPLTAEAAVALKPDVIIVADFAAKAVGGIEALRARPEIALTPAGRNGRIVPMDAMLLLGFGPRTPRAIAALSEALRGGAPAPKPKTN